MPLEIGRFWILQKVPNSLGVVSWVSDTRTVQPGGKWQVVGIKALGSHTSQLAAEPTLFLSHALGNFTASKRC